MWLHFLCVFSSRSACPRKDAQEGRFLQSSGLKLAQTFVSIVKDTYEDHKINKVKDFRCRLRNIFAGFQWRLRRAAGWRIPG